MPVCTLCRLHGNPDIRLAPNLARGETCDRCNEDYLSERLGLRVRRAHRNV